MTKITKKGYLRKDGNSLIRKLSSCNIVNIACANIMVDLFQVVSVDEQGVVRWKENNSIPSNELLGLWYYMGKKFNYDLSYETSKKEFVELTY